VASRLSYRIYYQLRLRFSRFSMSVGLDVPVFAAFIAE
jgi:hypothetical protein